MDRLTEQQQRLAEEAVSRAKRIAERYARIFPEHAADFESSANWGVVRAASSYKPDLGGVWERWSEMAIRGEIKDFLDNSYFKHQRPGGAMEGTEDDADLIAGVDAAENLERLLGLLPITQRVLCSLVYKMGMSPASAGVALGYSPNHGCKLHREAIEYLRETLAA